MILDEESTNYLRKFLIKTLEPICDADPPVLANYVIAILHNDKPRHELQDSCIQDLEDFLKDETKPFVSKLFDVLKEIENKQFVHLSPSHQNDRDYERDDEDRDHKHARRESPEHDRKRSYGADEEFRRKANGTHPTSIVEEPTRRRREDDHTSDDERRHFDKARHNRDDRFQPPPRGNFRRYGEFDGRERPYFEPGAARGGGRPDRGRYNNNNNNAPPFRPRPRQRCRDYDERGFCMRGETCTFDHGADRIIVPDMNEFQKLKNGDAAAMGVPGPIPVPIISLPPVVTPFAMNPEVDAYAPQPKRTKFDKGGRYDPTDMAPYNPESPMFGGGLAPMNMNNNNNNNWNQPPPSFDMGMNHRGMGRGGRPPRFPKPIGVPEHSIPLNPSVPFGYNNNNSNNNSNSIVLPTHVHNFPPVSDTRRVIVDSPPNMGGQPSTAAVELVPTVENKYRPFNTHNNNTNNNTNNNNNSNTGGNSNNNNNTGVNTNNNAGANNNNNNNNNTANNKGGFNSNFNNFNPNFKAQTTLLVTNIPPDLNSIDKLNSHFKKFGTVVNLQVKFAANKAYVQFINHNEAVRALRAVEAVLGNRFIKVFWANRPDENQQQGPQQPGAVPATSQPQETPVVKKEVPEVKPPAPLPSPVPFSTPAPSVSAAAKELQERRQQQIKQYAQLLDMMSNKLKTVTGQKEKEELLKSVKATTATLDELLKKDSTTLQQNIKQQQQAKDQQQHNTAPVKPPVPVVFAKVKAQKEKERLDRELDQMSSPSLSSHHVPASPLTSSTSSLTSSLNLSSSSIPTLPSPTPTAATATPATTTTTSTPTPTPSTAASLSHLQHLKSTLEQTALAMGLDTSSRGRGRGVRGRGAPPPRGGGRGGRGAPTATRGGATVGSGMTLDNRSTTLVVGGLPAELKNESALRAHFQTFGDVSSVVLQGDKASIQFAARRFAEAAVTQGRLFKTHNLNISWHDPTKPIAVSAERKVTPVNVNVNVNASAQDEEVVAMETTTETPEPPAHQFEEEDEEEDEGVERSWKH